MTGYIYAVVLLLNLLSKKISSNQMSQCSNLESNKLKILGSMSIMKVWLGSEVSVTCCMKDYKKANNEDIEDEFEVSSNKEPDSLMWYDPNMKPVINYFSDPLLAQKSGVFAIPDMIQKSNNVQMIHLVIRNYSLSNNGIYKCDTAQKSHEPAKLQLEGYQKIVIDAEEHQYLEEGNAGVIVCRPRGHNDIDVVWFYEGKHLSTDNHKFSFIDKHTNLGIYKVTEDIAGKYLCKAEVSFFNQNENTQQGQFIELQPIDVIVYQSPILSTESPIKIAGTVDGKLDDSVLELACEAKGLPPPVITWFKNKILLNSSLDLRIKITESYYRRNVYSTLRIFPVQIEDIGTYTCNASIQFKNFQRSDAKNITPELIFQPHFIGVLTNLNATTTVGSDIILNCSVFGATIDRVSLEFQQHDYNNNIHIYNNSTAKSRFIFEQYQDPENIYISHYRLKILDSQPSDAGWYNCKASLTFGNVYTLSNTGVFSVLYKPTVKSNKSTVFGLWFKKNVLECNSKGFPNPDWEWKFHGNKLAKDHNQYNLRVRNQNDTSISELIILPNYLNDAVFGSYDCTAKNQIGSDSANILFRQAWQPGPPNVEVCKITSSSIQLCISQNNDTGGLPLSHYELRIKEFDINRYVGPFYYPVSPSTITLSHLKSNMKYKFALSAVSEAGRGVNTYTEAATKPLSRPLIELVNTSVSPDWNAYNLRWVVDTDGGLPIVQYEVEIQQVRVDLQTRKIVERIGPVKSYVIHDIGQLKHMFRVNSLNPNTYYELKFWAANLIGPSPIQEVVFRTLELPQSLASSSRLRDPFGSAKPMFNYRFLNSASLLLIIFLLKIQS